MTDQQPRRGRGRPPTNGTKFGRLYVNVPTGIIAALTAEAEARGVSLSALTRTILAEWRRAELPAGRIPHQAAAKTGVQTPVPVEQSAYRADETDRRDQ